MHIGVVRQSMANTNTEYHMIQLNSDANSQISWGGKIYYDVGEICLRRHAKSPV